VAGVGVVERGMDGGGDEMGIDGTVDKFPDVVNGVRSSSSGKTIRMAFLAAYWP
jgi:hypothetical protein